MKLKDWLKILIFAAVIALLTIGASFFLAVPEARDVSGMYGFYKEEENSIDVALIGQSTTFTAFYSPLAYAEEGFTSYAIATSSLAGAAYPSAAREVLQTQSPKVWVIDVIGFCEEDQKNSYSSRMWLDSIKDGPNRKQSIEELVPESDREGYKVPFSVYHNNWQRIKGCFKTLIDKMDINSKGYSVTKNFCAYTDHSDEEVWNEKFDFSEEGLIALDDFIKFLKDQDIENVFFIRTPRRQIIEDGDNYLRGIEMIESAGFDYVDYASFSSIDVNDDFYDFEHLNIFGTQKFTKILAREINERYKIQTDHSAETKERWDNCVSLIPQVFAKAEQRTEQRIRQGLYTQRDFLK